MKFLLFSVNPFLLDVPPETSCQSWSAHIIGRCQLAKAGCGVGQFADFGGK
jgi:hypothetical protein